MSMSGWLRRRFPETVEGSASFGALLAFAFFAGVSMPLARICLVAALVLVVRDAALGRIRWRVSAPAWGWIAYALTALFVTVLAVATLPEGALIDPARGLRKLDKLLWYAGALVLPPVVTTRERFRGVVRAFAMGCGVYAAALLILHPPAAWVLAHYSNPAGRGAVWRPEAGTTSARFLSAVDALGLTKTMQKACRGCCARGSFNIALAWLSGMGAGQRLMAGTLAALSLCGGAATRRDRRRSLLLAVLTALGLAITLKRGSLLVCVVVGGVVAVHWAGWRRALAALAVAVALVMALPPARHRLLQLPDEFRPERGGRALMWTELVPEMRRAHPMGVGFRGLTFDALRKAPTPNAWRLELNQNHLHNNFLQVLVELGWAGLAVYLAWMGISFRVVVRRARTAWADAGGGDALLRTAPLLILSALFLNGFVEYNLADAEVTLLYGLAMGLGCSAIGANPAMNLDPVPDQP